LSQVLCPEYSLHTQHESRHYGLGGTLQLVEDVFKLQHLLDAHLLAFTEEVEELAGSAAKEAQVEARLSAMEVEWEAGKLTQYHTPYVYRVTTHR